MAADTRAPKAVLADLLHDAPGPQDGPADRIEWLWAVADQLSAAGMSKLAETTYVAARDLLAEQIATVSGKAGA
ncbi:hypothetical protein [Amycolatopsis magusensis]|uniref:hypothetical protein n=1 Tax=Amycolatopsis magusensis TaxID=882444 RepID=UPI0037891233